MQKITKKLTLKRETIRELTDSEAGYVHGGAEQSGTCTLKTLYAKCTQPDKTKPFQSMTTNCRNNCGTTYDIGCDSIAFCP